MDTELAGKREGPPCSMSILSFQNKGKGKKKNRDRAIIKVSWKWEVVGKNKCKKENS